MWDPLAGSVAVGFHHTQIWFQRENQIEAWMSARSDATQLWLSLSCSGAEIIAKNRSEIVLGATVDSLS